MKKLCSMNCDIARVSICTIDKSDAQMYLDNNNNNRPINTGNVSMLLSTMNDGKWMFNGDTIVVDSSGSLKSGQHRLTAFVKSNLEEMNVIIVRLNNDDDVLVSLNRGARMNVGQYLKIKGVKMGVETAGVIRWIYKCENGIDLSSRENVADYKLEEEYIKHKNDIDDFIRYCKRDVSRIATYLLSALCYTSILRPDVKSRMLQICESVAEGISERGSIENAVFRLNRDTKGTGGTPQLAIYFSKAISLIGQYVADGKVKDKLYGIKVSDFKNLITQKC